MSKYCAKHFYMMNVLVFLLFPTNDRCNDLTPKNFLCGKCYNFVCEWLRFVDQDLKQWCIYFSRIFHPPVMSVHNYKSISILPQNVILHSHFCQYPIILGKMVYPLHLQTFKNIFWFIPPVTVPIDSYNSSMDTPNTNWYSSSLLSQFLLDNSFQFYHCT